MIAEETLFFHIGIHKTGSSFMQRQFFPSVRGLHYLDIRTHCRGFLEYVLRVDEFIYDKSEARRRFELRPENGNCKVTVVSDEMFYAPLQWSRYTNRSRGIQRLLDLFPQAHFVIVLRNQPSLLRSLYRMYVKTGGSAGLADFLEYHTAPGYLRFYEYVDYLSRVAGKQRVTVFLYEDFVQNPINFLNNWCELLGVTNDDWSHIIGKRENPSISSRLLPILRVANRFVSSQRNPQLLFPKYFHDGLSSFLLLMSGLAGKGTSTSSFERSERFRLLIDDCRKGNRMLAAVLERDLQNLGYPC